MRADVWFDDDDDDDDDDRDQDKMLYMIHDTEKGDMAFT